MDIAIFKAADESAVLVDPSLDLGLIHLLGFPSDNQSYNSYLFLKL